MALTDTKVRSAKPEEKEYSLVDGDGMSLLVKPGGSKYWRFRFRFGGKQHLMAFGGCFAGGCAEEKGRGQKAGSCWYRSS